MDELAKNEARNYLSAAGFFLIAALFVLRFFICVETTTFVQTNNFLQLGLGIGLLIVATLLIVLHKRDMIAILFFMIGFFQLFSAFTSPGTWNTILVSLMLLVALVTLTGQDKKKWMLFIIPLLWFIHRIMRELFGYNRELTIIFYIIMAIISLYYAFCCASERIGFLGRKLLTTDESTDFKASGSALGYMLFAILSLSYVFYYFCGESFFPLELAETLKVIAGILLVYVSILLLAVGKMRFTPVMFLIAALVSIIEYSCTGNMFIGIAILWVVLGLFAMLRKESRILPGIMFIIYGGTCFIAAPSTGGAIGFMIASAILNAIPCLIAIYLAFAVYSQGKLPKF